MRPYKVSKLSAPPVYDSLPVAKITDYPLEKRDYKPYAQCIFCVGGDRLYLRMWAFEVSPAPTSALLCVTYPFREHPDRGLEVRIAHGEGHSITATARITGDGGAVLNNLETHPHSGEDLQGIYWGMSVSLPLADIRGTWGEPAFSPGDELPGNFYKICEDPRWSHMGSHFPARFPDDPFGPASMGVFQVVSY